MHNISSPPFSREPAPSSPALVILSQSLDFLQEHPPCNNRAPEHLLQGAILDALTYSKRLSQKA